VKQLVVVSGKGGTGKTVVTASFAALAGRAVLGDLDVDASNLHLLLGPEVEERGPFTAGQKARIDASLCRGCGRCAEVCRFDAIILDAENKARVDSLSCEGCALCCRVCEAKAVGMVPNEAGEWIISKTRHGPMVHARLGVAQENSGKLVTEVRKRAREIALREGRELLLMDGPPGIGCPVIASLSGVDLALVVTEPTPSGAQDMERAVDLARHFRLRAACAINKDDLNLENSKKIESWCAKRGIPLAGRIPFDSAVVDSVVAGVPAVEYAGGPAAESLRRLWNGIRDLLA
jgi:MinD superfamily P-loop ATPase